MCAWQALHSYSDGRIGLYTDTLISSSTLITLASFNTFFFYHHSHQKQASQGHDITEKKYLSLILNHNYLELVGCPLYTDIVVSLCAFMSSLPHPRTLKFVHKFILCIESSYVCMIIFQMSYNHQSEIKTKYIINHYLGFFNIMFDFLSLVIPQPCSFRFMDI